MNATDAATTLEQQIDQWRIFLRKRQAVHAVDIAELEDHLREQVAVLVYSGLDADEAFLVAVKRMGNLDAISREFAREHSDRLWKQLVLDSSDAGAQGPGVHKEAIVAFCFAAGAALAIKIPALFGMPLDDGAAGFYMRNLSLFILPLLAGFFVWKRKTASPKILYLAGAFIAAAIAANAFPVTPGGSTEALAALHLPIALWLVVGVAYAGDRWREPGGRMDFIRFSGELFIYYVLIALGGGVLFGFMALIFNAIGIDVEPFFESWLLPCGATGGLVIASWLVEAKQSVIENMAPVLTRLFTPLFAAMLVTFLAVMVLTGRGLDMDRDVLIAFDLLLVMVLALLLYSISARDPDAGPGAFDIAQVVLVASALIADAVALWAIAARISEFGASPNRVAALGVNVMLLVNLSRSAVLYLNFLRGRGSFTRIERWQTRYVPVYAAWAAIVAVIFPPLFGYV